MGLLLFILFFGEANAQQSRVDSAIALLNKSNTVKGLDSHAFINAIDMINSAVLADPQIGQIEKAAEQFKQGNDEDLCYTIKVRILSSLSATDKFKAIDYGHKQLDLLETSKTPQSKFLNRAFLQLLRVPYRTSAMRFMW